MGVNLNYVTTSLSCKGTQHCMPLKDVSIIDDLRPKTFKESVSDNENYINVCTFEQWKKIVPMQNTDTTAISIIITTNQLLM